MTDEADRLADFYAEHLGHVTSSALDQLMELFDQSGIQSLPPAAKDALEKLILNSYEEIKYKRTITRSLLNRPPR